MMVRDSKQAGSLFLTSPRLRPARGERGQAVLGLEA
jgi:hypothetical protein